MSTPAPTSAYARAALALICLSCAGPGGNRETQELCAGCWSLLPPQTRARLRQRDHEATDRTFQLLSAIRRGVRLERIDVSA